MFKPSDVDDDVGEFVQIGYFVQFEWAIVPNLLNSSLLNDTIAMLCTFWFCYQCGPNEINVVAKFLFCSKSNSERNTRVGFRYYFYENSIFRLPAPDFAS